jgi:hypothetical protein
MDEQKQKLIDRISGAQNILVTVSSNPSVDQLAAAIGLTLVLNQMDKHGTAVFSGQVPSTMEFLKPEATLEKNTDSLRDFIIALDKSKADKLRYKVEDEVVRIFITPYKTSLSEKDLDFSQGDFNVDVVVALGVTEQQDLDSAITAHGRILHDATVASISTTGQGSLGSINWVDPKASSLSEMMVALIDGLDKKALNNQVATALLTGIVASTERFRNDKTTPRTMSASATLMAAGANQQLIATELETKPEPPAPAPEVYQDPRTEQHDAPQHDAAPAPKKAEPGTLEIAHEPEERLNVPASEADAEPEPEPEHPQIHVDENGQLILPGQDTAQQGPTEPTDFQKELDAITLPPEPPLPTISHVRGVGSNGQATESENAGGDKSGPKVEVHRELMTKMPELGAPSITANTQEEDEFEPTTEELTLPALDAPLLSHTTSVLGSDAVAPPLPPAPIAPQTPPPIEPLFNIPSQQPISTVTPAPQPSLPKYDDDETLTEIEQSVSSPHLHMNDAAPAPAEPTVSNLDDARSAVEAALSGAGNVPTALNALPLGPELHDQPSAPTPAPAQVQQPYIPSADLFSPAPAPAPTASVTPTVPNLGFSEPTPGNTPADDTLDMPLPAAMPGTFASPTASTQPQPYDPTSPSGQAPPPVPPPMIPRP